MDWHPVISVQQQTPDNDFRHFSISNVRFAFWAFVSKTGKTRVSHRVKMMTRWRSWKMTQMTHWPGDPVTQFHVWSTQLVRFALGRQRRATKISDDHDHSKHEHGREAKQVNKIIRQQNSRATTETAKICMNWSAGQEAAANQQLASNCQPKTGKSRPIRSSNKFE